MCTRQKSNTTTDWSDNTRFRYVPFTLKVSRNVHSYTTLNENTAYGVYYIATGELVKRLLEPADASSLDEQN